LEDDLALDRKPMMGEKQRVLLCPNGHEAQHIVKRGIRRNKTGPVQLYYCKQCGAKFAETTSFSHEKERMKDIAFALASKGLSLNDVTSHLQQFHSFQGSRQAVYNWILDRNQGTYPKGKATSRSMRERYEERIKRLQSKLDKLSAKVATLQPERKPRGQNPKCPRCGSDRVVRRGVRRARGTVTQRYGCRGCGYLFGESEPAFSRKRVDPFIISLALNAYFAGASIRRIVDMLTQLFNLHTTPATLLRWFDEYPPAVAKFLRGVQVNGGDIWQFANRKLTVNGVSYVLWIVIEKTKRFILASHIGSLTTESAVEALNIAKQQSSTAPKVIETDYWDGYSDAIHTVFGNSVAHSPPPSPEIGFTHINKLIATTGRLYGSKQTDTFKTLEGARNIVDGLTISHNYIWPADDLNGKTPAEALNSRINLQGDRWQQIIKLAFADKAFVLHREEQGEVLDQQAT